MSALITFEVPIADVQKVCSLLFGCKIVEIKKDYITGLPSEIIEMIGRKSENLYRTCKALFDIKVEIERRKRERYNLWLKRLNTEIPPSFFKKLMKKDVPFENIKKVVDKMRFKRKHRIFYHLTRKTVLERGIYANDYQNDDEPLPSILEKIKGTRMMEAKAFAVLKDRDNVKEFFQGNKEFFELPSQNYLKERFMEILEIPTEGLDHYLYEFYYIYGFSYTITCSEERIKEIVHLLRNTDARMVDINRDGEQWDFMCNLPHLLLRERFDVVGITEIFISEDEDEGHMEQFIELVKEVDYPIRSVRIVCGYTVRFLEYAHVLEARGIHMTDIDGDSLSIECFSVREAIVAVEYLMLCEHCGCFSWEQLENWDIVDDEDGDILYLHFDTESG